MLESGQQIGRSQAKNIGIRNIYHGSNKVVSDNNNTPEKNELPVHKTVSSPRRRKCRTPEKTTTVRKLKTTVAEKGHF